MGSNNGSDEQSFREALRVGDEEQVLKYVTQGVVNVDGKDSAGATPLHDAVIFGNRIWNSTKIYYNNKVIDVDKYDNFLKPLDKFLIEKCFKLVNILLLAGASINETNNQGDTALHIAARSNRIEIFGKLLRSGATELAKNHNNETPMDVAASHGCLKALQMELLHNAIRLCNGDLARKFLDLGVDPNEKNWKGDTALHVATKRNQLKLVDNQHDNSENSDDAANNEVCTTSNLADRNYTSMVKLLVEMGANIEAEDEYGYRALHLAVVNNYTETVKLLIELGAKTKIKQKTACFCGTALDFAVLFKRTEIVKLLIDMGAYNDAAPGTALHLMVSHSNTKMVEKLLKLGANIDATDNEDRTSLHLAVESSDTEMVTLLVELGANIEATDIAGHTSLHEAVVDDDSQMVNLLLDLGANIDATEVRGRTSLHLAVVDNNSQMVNLLLDLGANIDAIDNEGSTAIDLGMNTYYLKHSIMTLLNYGASFNVADVFNPTKYWKLFGNDKKIIYHHIIKLILAELLVEHLERFEKSFNDYEEYKYFKSMYSQELEVINTTKVYGDITLGILFSRHQNPCYIVNRELVSSIQQLLDSPELVKTFPHYGDILKDTFNRSKKSYQLFYLATLSLNNFLKCCDIVIPIEVTNIIVGHLDKSSKRQLVKSGLYCVPSDPAQSWCDYLPDLLKVGVLGQYLSDIVLNKLLKDQLIVIPKTDQI